VSVAPSFLIAAVILGYSDDLPAVVSWVVVVFVSVLVHELGHALVGKALGGRPEIQLEGFGGVTFPRLAAPATPSRQIVLSLAGPFAGLLLGAAAVAVKAVIVPEPGSLSALLIRQFQFTSVAWAVLNLLPVLPLDGGQVLLAVLEGLRKRPSVRAASLISGLVAAAAAVAAWVLFGQQFAAIWLALMAVQNFARARSVPVPAAAGPGRALGHDAAPDEHADVDRELARARAALLAGDEQTALAVASKLEEAEGPYRQAAGLRIRAGVELARGDNVAAGLHAGRSFTLWQGPDAAVVAARANLRAGERDRALNWLRRAVEAGAHPGAVREDPELGGLS
jgi:Zn-dependent protease